MSVSEVKDLWAVEYSESQGTFNVQSLSGSVEDNLEMFLKSMPCDHAVVAVTNKREEADSILAVLDSRLDRTVPFSEDERAAIRKRLLMMGAMEFRSNR